MDLGIPFELPLHRDDFNAAVGYLATATPEIPYFQTTIGELLETDLPLFVYMLREQADRVAEANTRRRKRGR